MSTAQPAPTTAADSARTRIGLMQILGIPAVDKTIAVVASIPFVYALYRRISEGNLNIPLACAAMGLLVVVVTMLLRRAPQRVTPNYRLVRGGVEVLAFWHAKRGSGPPLG